jgi:hypothetical protein
MDVVRELRPELLQKLRESYIAAVQPNYYMLFKHYFEKLILQVKFRNFLVFALFSSSFFAFSCSSLPLCLWFVFIYVCVAFSLLFFFDLLYVLFFFIIFFASSCSSWPLRL